LRRQILSLVRLPIPPLSHGVHKFLNSHQLLQVHAAFLPFLGCGFCLILPVCQTRSSTLPLQGTELDNRGEAGINDYEGRYAALSSIRNQLQSSMNAVEPKQPGVSDGPDRYKSRPVLKGLLPQEISLFICVRPAASAAGDLVRGVIGQCLPDYCPA
jgi:hypothetical protein